MRHACFLFTLSIILVSGTAWADLSPLTAQYVCGRLDEPSGDKARCNSLIAHSTFDQWAAGECDSYQTSPDTLQCMLNIRNKTYTSYAVVACDRMPDVPTANSCLRAIAGKNLSHEQVAQCDAVSDANGTVACFSNYRGVVAAPAPTPSPAPKNTLTWTEATRSCDLVSPVGAVIEHKAVTDCIAEPSTSFAWVDSDLKKCAAYTDKLEFLDFVDAGKCSESGLECLHGTGVLASTDTAMIEGTLYHLVPEILKLRDKETVPADVYTKYSPELVAASLVRRLHNVNEATANVEHPVYDYESDAIIQMKFHSSTFEAIAKGKGGFLNQHEINHSGGLLDQGRRASIENSLIDVRLEPTYHYGRTNPVNTVRPKYAFLSFEKNATGQQRNDFSRQYGNVVAVMKNEIKDRATFTAVDSLDGDMDSSDNIDYGRIRAYSFKYRSATPIAKIYDPNGEKYWESQMWGPLTFSDVDYFLVNCPGDTPVSAASLVSMKKAGLPIYKCDFVPDHSHFQKGEQLYAGDPRLAPKPRPQSGTDTSKFVDTSAPAGP
jgi:hypothetical protein